MLGRGDRTVTATEDAAGEQTPAITSQKSKSKQKFAEGGSQHMVARQAAEPAPAGQTGTKKRRPVRSARPAVCRGRPGLASAVREERQMLTRQDMENFGPELLDVAQRAAQHALAPDLQRLQDENQDLREEVSRAAKWRSIENWMLPYRTGERLITILGSISGCFYRIPIAGL